MYYPPKPGGRNRFYFDTVGNHDRDEPTTYQRAACGVDPPLSYCVDQRAIRNEVLTRKRVTPITKLGITYGTGLYSWDWHDVHFVSTGLFAGNEKASGSDPLPNPLTCNTVMFPGGCSRGYPGPEPGRALDFLRDDLHESVGSSGRPVVITQHYGFDSFSIGASQCKCKVEAVTRCDSEVWWNESQREALWDVVAPYNVVAFYTGHVHSHPGSSIERAFDRPASRSVGPDTIATYVAGAARHGVFHDVEFTDSGGCAPKADETCLVTTAYDARSGAAVKTGTPITIAVKTRK